MFYSLSSFYVIFCRLPFFVIALTVFSVRLFYFFFDKSSFEIDMACIFLKDILRSLALISWIMVCHLFSEAIPFYHLIWFYLSCLFRKYDYPLLPILIFVTELLGTLSSVFIFVSLYICWFISSFNSLLLSDTWWYINKNDISC